MHYTNQTQHALFFRLILFLFLTLGISSPFYAQQGKYKAFFDEAYTKFPSVPQGLLEAVAYTNSRLTHLDGTPSCQGLPTYFGVMGLVENGQDYFKNSLITVSELSGYSIEEIKKDPRINILAYASAYSKLQGNYRLMNNRVETHKVIVDELSELPNEEELLNKYANDQHFYGILREMQNPHTQTGHRMSRNIDIQSVFGPNNYRVLNAKKVTVSEQRVSSETGEEFRVTDGAGCTSASPNPDFEGAVWKKAHSNNYGSRGNKTIKYITIHTIQGSYSSAISWFRNRDARVSAHYIIRASDGQVTQMVCEKDRAFHVRTDNAEAVGIEHEGFVDDGAAWYTQAMYQSSADLVKDICERNNIDPLKTFTGPGTKGINELSNTCYHVKGHQHFRGNSHVDPGKYWDWERYYRLINGAATPKVFTRKNGEILDTGKKNNNYGNMERRAYVIKPAGATSVSLEFLTFNLEVGSDGTKFDYMDIYDGESPNGRFLGRFSGSRKPANLIANSGKFYLEFRSDCRTTRSGYHIRYRSQTTSDACGVPTDLLATELTPLSAKLTWNGSATRYTLKIRQNNENDWQEYKVNGTQQVVSGLNANGVFEWQVRSECGNESSGWVGTSFLAPNIIRSSEAQVYTVRANSGKFLDTGGRLAQYSNKEKYIYRIIPPNGGKVELTFTSFDTEANEDFLTIYDGTDIGTATKMGTFSGSNNPPTLTSTGNGMSILFESDPMVIGQGWIATWRSIGGSVVVTPDPTPDPDPVDPAPTPDPPANVAIGSFDPDLYLTRYPPETRPQLKSTYKTDFSLSFKDRDRSGRGLVNRFYLVAQDGSKGMKANSRAGFRYDNFDKGLPTDWKIADGTWFVQDGRLVQSDVSDDNTNIYAPLSQTGDATYIYSWQSKMIGNGSNMRHGFHFFCSEPEKANRGNSYFIWIRKTDEGANVEIYKSAFNEYDRKVQKPFDLKDNKAYDFKTIYNPQKGRIEVYVNNRSVASWTDPYPIRAGKGISLRTGNSVTVYDNLRVYKNRTDKVSISTGKADSPINKDGKFLVESLVIDGFIHWSQPTFANSTFGSTATPGDGGNNGLPVYNRDFEAALEQGGGDLFVMASDYDGKKWGANGKFGFARDDFSRTQLTGWKSKAGNWKIVNGELDQADANQSNSNLYLPLTQDNKHKYLYHYKVKLLEDKDNVRFGMHFFASQGSGKNRGSSYMVWFRHYKDGTDRVEIYRSDDNSMPGINFMKNVSFNSLEFNDIKVVYDPSVGQITAYLNNQEVVSWKDPGRAHQSGKFISLRTGNAKAAFDDIRVYRSEKSTSMDITVGPNDMLRHTTSGDDPVGELLGIKLQSNGKWVPINTQSFIIR
ncbi:MAG: CUB domain-containing protein [Bacteroidota bacterium]